MSEIFPHEIVALFAQSRPALVALRCTCRAFQGLTAAIPWSVELVGGECKTWIELLYRDTGSWFLPKSYPDRNHNQTLVYADGEVVARFRMRNWRRAHLRLRSRYIFECKLVGIDPIVPASIERKRSNLYTECGAVITLTSESGHTCELWRNFGQTMVTTGVRSPLFEHLLERDGGEMVVFAVMTRASEL